MSALPGYMTLLDIAKANGSDQTTGLIDETTKATPEVRLGSSRTLRGKSYKTWVRTALPGSTFRDANQGVAATKGVYEPRVVETFIMNPRWEADKAVADGYEFGAQAYIAEEADGQLTASMQTLGRQFYYGRNQYQVGGVGPDGTAGTFFGGDLKGFPGLIDGFNNTYQFDAAGTTANTASSVWGVKWGTKFVNWVWGMDGQLAIPPVTVQRVLDKNSLAFDAYCSSMLAYPGLQIGDTRGVLRIKNITADSGKTLTDSMIFSAISLLPAAMTPDMLLMNRRSVTQLRMSRTATNVTGAPAPIPTESAGIPIVLTDSINNNEPINYLGF